MLFAMEETGAARPETVWSGGGEPWVGAPERGSTGPEPPMGSAEELTEPPMGSEGAVPPMGSPAADGVAARGLGEGGIVEGTEDGKPSVPIGATVSLRGELFLSLLGLE